MSDRAKSVWKKVLREVLSFLIVAAVVAVIWYFSNGWPIAGNLRKQAEEGKISQVRITQMGNTVTVTDAGQIELAAGVAQLLTVSLPGADGEGEVPETELLFTFTDGKTLQIGVSEETVFKDGKRYAPGGDKTSPKLFHNVTEGLFFLDKAMDR